MGGGVGGKGCDSRGVADWAVEIFFAPWFGANAGALGGAGVAVKTCGWELHVHAGIRSWRPDKTKVRNERRKRDSSLHRPTRSQEANAEEKASACSAQNDGARQRP